eukprot:235747-Hanusia_phi.AAC.1
MTVFPSRSRCFTDEVREDAEDDPVGGLTRSQSSRRSSLRASSMLPAARQDLQEGREPTFPPPPDSMQIVMRRVDVARAGQPDATEKESAMER